MKTLTLLLLWCFASLFCTAQLKIMDLSVVPLTPALTNINDSTKIMVQFKINEPDSVQNIQMKFGTVQDNADVALLNPTIIFSAPKYYTLFNGEQHEIADYDARVFYTLSEEQINAYNYLTLTVSYIDGSSDTLYWLKRDQNQ